MFQARRQSCRARISSRRAGGVLRLVIRQADLELRTEPAEGGHIGFPKQLLLRRRRRLRPGFAARFAERGNAVGHGFGESLARCSAFGLSFFINSTRIPQFPSLCTKRRTCALGRPKAAARQHNRLVGFLLCRHRPELAADAGLLSEFLRYRGRCRPAKFGFMAFIRASRGPALLLADGPS